MTLDGRLDDSVWTSIDWYGQPADVRTPVDRPKSFYPVRQRPLRESLAAIDAPDADDGVLPQHRPQRLLVKVDAAGKARLSEQLAAWGERRPRHLFSLRDRAAATADASWVMLSTSDARRGELLARLIREMPGVLRVEYDAVRNLSGTTPNDPEYSEQWALSHMGAPDAWDVATGGATPATVAVIDTGVDWRHPDITPNLWVNPGEDLDDNGVMTESDLNGIDDDGNGYVDDLIGWDFVDLEGEEGVTPPDSNEDAYTEDNNPMDYSGHGTHVASLALARGNNSAGMTGVAWSGRAMCLRAGYGYQGGGGGTLVSAAVRAIVYAVENGARVVTLAWSSSIPSQIEQDAMNWAARSGVVLCAAVGDHLAAPDGTSSPNYPAAYPKVLAVTGTDQDRQLAYFEYSWYYGAYAAWGDWIDLSAPAVDLLCAAPVSPWESGGHDYVHSDLAALSLAASTNESYIVGSGTSFSCALTAGAAALIASHYPDADAQEITYRLLSGTTDTDPYNSGREGLMGAGELHMGNALKRLNADAIAEPALLAVEMTGAVTNDVRIVHTAVPGWSYQVEVRDSVTDTWQAAADPTTAVPGEFAMEWFDGSGATSRLYRVARILETPGDPPTQ